MYVLADLEWVTNAHDKISLTQIALMRVDEQWDVMQQIYYRIRPTGPSFHRWDHMGFTGGSPEDFLSAPQGLQVFEEILSWLRPDDILCWWHSDARSFIQTHCPAIANSQVLLEGSVAKHLKRKLPLNPYKIGQSKNIPAPGVPHDSRSDVEMIRRVLQDIRLPQPFQEIPVPPSQNHASVRNMAYHAHLGTNMLHRNGCPRLPATGHVKGYNELTKPVKKGYIPCQCIREQFLAVRKQRNRSILGNPNFCFAYAPNSKVFHRKECSRILTAKSVVGTYHYKTCTKSGRRPCRICSPTPDHERISVPDLSHRGTNNVQGRQLSHDEQRAIQRLKEAQSQQNTIRKRTDLSPEEKKDMITLAQPVYAFYAAKGYQNFHLRNCRKLSGLSDIKGFSMYQDACHSGYRPCKICNPTSKHNVTVSLPIYSTQRPGESPDILAALCERVHIRHWIDTEYSYMQTPMGIWRIHSQAAPYRLDHINLIHTPNNSDTFHRQPRLFLSLTDVFHYICKHDKVPTSVPAKANAPEEILPDSAVANDTPFPLDTDHNNTGGLTL
jgi:methylphosphotriester-DNA--protein-cysteine methyltransferase